VTTRKTSRSRALLQAMVAAAAMIVAATGVAQRSESELELGIKAAYLYKFLGYVEWPPSAFASAQAPIAVGVVGAEDIAAELARTVAGRKVDGRDVVVVELRRGQSLAGLHALFVGNDQTARADALIRAAHPLGILTITDAAGALERGSVINFVRVGDNVRFEISIDAAERSGLKLSSRLLAVATAVRMGPS
jgi:hypothetical protein